MNPERRQELDEYDAALRLTGEAPYEQLRMKLGKAVLSDDNVCRAEEDFNWLVDEQLKSGDNLSIQTENQAAKAKATFSYFMRGYRYDKS